MMELLFTLTYYYNRVTFADERTLLKSAILVKKKKIDEQQGGARARIPQPRRANRAVSGR
jgi:hypothetical protein